MLTDRFLKWFLRKTANQGVQSLCDLPIAISTDLGLVRKENQDRVAVMRIAKSSANKPFVVVALADGMGGMIDGRECASRALASFFNSLIVYRKESPRKRLELASREANSFVYEFAKGKGGSTLSAILIEAGSPPVTLNIGDSRIYATQSSSTDDIELIRLTIDDTLEEAVGGSGKELLQFVGMGDEISPHVDEVPSDKLKVLISSDGVHFIRHEKLKDVLSTDNQFETAAEKLNELVKQDGAPDNASLILASLSGIETALAEPSAATIEVYDPFCALHVVWQTSPHNQQLVRIYEDLKAKEKQESPKEPRGTRKAKSGTTKSKKKKKSSDKPPKQNGPQLTLDVN